MSTNRYDLDHAAAVKDKAVLRYITTTKFDGEWNSYLHTHTCAEVFYVTGGKGQFRIEDRVYPAATGDLVVINPYVMHTETSVDPAPLEYIVLGVDGLELSARGDQLRPFYIAHLNSGEVLFYLRDMLREMDGKSPGYESVCQDLLDVVLIRLMRIPDFAVELVPTNLQASKESAVVRRYIENHFKENITLDLLAETAHINKYHLAHLYTKDYGISPISYLLSLRIQESRYLLQSTDLPLAQIARIIGFSSPSYFSQSFRRSEGISPTEFRQRSRQK